MLQPTSSVAALIGDLVGSRRSQDRAELQRQMFKVFADVHRLVGGDPTFTIGDEFQARYPTMGQALEASLQLHLRASALNRLRIGIGWGELVAEDPARSPFGQDGPCWWRARDAIESIERSSKGRPRLLRTAVRSETALDPLFNGYLSLRDALIGGMDEVDIEIAIGLLDGVTQTEVAKRLGLNKSSVSRRAGAHGILALVEARNVGSPPLPVAP
ncbi:MAG TPA: SatD family protein [Acidimicrobiia bacterium]|nr:SatD family protein [Acidimicrobiia bacterium]